MIPLPLRLVAAPVTLVIVLTGAWLTGGVLTDDFRASMALSAAWFAAVAAAALVVWRRAPALRLPVSVVAVVTVAAVAGFLGLTSVLDKEVNESVASGPALAAGAFFGLAHDTTGRAAVVRAPDGSVKLTLTEFETDPGPDLYVYLVPGETDGRGVDRGTRLGRLKGNIGNQQYDVPAGFALSAGATVVVWCRAFSVSFGAATVAAT
jgi:hypothetical protein